MRMRGVPAKKRDEKRIDGIGAIGSWCPDTYCTLFTMSGWWEDAPAVVTLLRKSDCTIIDHCPQRTRFKDGCKDKTTSGTCDNVEITRDRRCRSLAVFQFSDQWNVQWRKIQARIMISILRRGKAF